MFSLSDSEFLKRDLLGEVWVACRMYHCRPRPGLFHQEVSFILDELLTKGQVHKYQLEVYSTSRMGSWSGFLTSLYREGIVSHLRLIVLQYSLY